jgi:hypothetical protein
MNIFKRLLVRKKVVRKRIRKRRKNDLDLKLSNIKIN